MLPSAVTCAATCALSVTQFGVQHPAHDGGSESGTVSVIVPPLLYVAALRTGKVSSVHAEVDCRLATVGAAMLRFGEPGAVLDGPL